MKSDKHIAVAPYRLSNVKRIELDRNRIRPIKKGGGYRRFSKCSYNTSVFSEKPGNQYNGSRLKTQRKYRVSHTQHL